MSRQWATSPSLKFLPVPRNFSSPLRPENWIDFKLNVPLFAEVASNPLEVSIMSKLAIWAEVEAKPGKEQAVAEFLKSAQALAEKEPGTITWYAVKLGGAKFGIFDTFADEKGREAHLNGEIAKALFGKAQELFVKEPQVHKLEILAAKAAGGAKAYGA
jgi:quinol monooxygenase YgiN